MSEALINTSQPAPLQAYTLRKSQEAWDYYRSKPYPQWAFGAEQWPLDKGPAPTPLGYAQLLVSEGAEFVFRNGSPQFSVSDDPSADELLKQVIKQNELESQWISLAEACGNGGAIFAKFSVDGDDTRCPVRISFLDMPQDCRVWCDPHDKERILMARIQYPYRDLDTGDWMLFREEWTDDLHVTYRPKYGGAAKLQTESEIPGYDTNLGDGDGWEVESQEDNPFGLIPGVVIRNRAVKGSPLGEGDCWHVFRIIDRIAITMHGEDRSNQMHSNPNLVTLNAIASNTDPLLPGEELELHQKKGGPPADVKLLEPTGAAREYSHRSIDKWEELLYKTVGLSRVNPAEVTNKGNMTELAFKMTFSRTIATADRKRQLWGDSGMAKFFRKVLLGLKSLGGFKQISSVSDDVVVSCEWPPYFEQTDDDKKSLTDRTATQVEKGFVTHERGAERVARAEKIPAHEIKDMLVQLSAERAARQAQATAGDNAGDSTLDAPTA